MSRIGNKIIELPKGVNVSVKDCMVTVKGPKGTLEQFIDPAITVNLTEDIVTVKRSTEEKKHCALHGLYRMLIYNMVVGVNEGYTRQLEVVGVGYKAKVEGNVLHLALGYSHPIYLVLAKEIVATAEATKGKTSNLVITLQCIDKELIGKVAAKIRSLRKVEPYKGKGIRYKGEEVRRKAGKTAKK